MKLDAATLTGLKDSCVILQQQAMEKAVKEAERVAVVQAVQVEYQLL